MTSQGLPTQVGSSTALGTQQDVITRASGNTTTGVEIAAALFTGAAAVSID